MVYDTVFLNESGVFKMLVPIDECGPAWLSDGKESTQLYLYPGDSIHIVLNASEFDESILYTGDGAARNNFLAQYYLKFNDFGKGDFIDFFMLRDTAIQAYMDVIYQDEKTRKNYLEQNHLINDYPTEFIEFMKTGIHFNRMEYFIYLFYNGGSLAAPNADPQLISQVKEQIISGVDYIDPDYLAPGYQWWLYATLPHVLTMNIIEEDEDLKTNSKKFDSVLFGKLAEIITPYELQLAIYSLMRDYSLSFDLESMEQLNPIVSKYVDDPTFREPIDSLFTTVSEKLKQTIPEDAELYDLDNPELSNITFEDILESYQGKVIYLDFWASWCGPCKGEMPYSADLSNQFIDEDVTFLYVSTDRDSVAWKEMIKIMQIEGIHYRLGENTREDVFERFGIEFIPHYVLFDQDGNMVKNNMTRPSETETEIQIRELIQK
ncbi:MAG: TlpA disulfide reductase family protein [Bacteroidales bacterium]|jgi:thiol-disulfide isomerase/thioredoxin|nr:TlpA disulfide reductase family protein [Bacteroidales bacterium]